MSAWGSSFGSCSSYEEIYVPVDTVLSSEILDILSTSIADFEEATTNIYIGPSVSNVTDESIKISLDDTSGVSI